MRSSCLVFFIFGVLHFSCGTSKQEQSGDTQNKREPAGITQQVPIPPNNCRVVATVESIDKSLQSADKDGPCSKAPCSATIKIDSVIGYGSAFPGTLAGGERVNVKFALTLSPTARLFPDVTPALPGLDVGDKFEANINGSVSMGEKKPSFTVYGYDKK
ncbi:MAG: hypothetical protein HW412_1851 [Bacteroidetes bacterium]|nr:hypothetical protein [Bacteroidota bacterium]